MANTIRNATDDLLDELRRTSRYIDTQRHGDGELDVRHWGDWEVDPQDRYDPDYGDEDFQDWDWKVLTEQSAKDLAFYVARIEKSHGVKIDVSPSEKCWITFTVTAA